MSVVERENIFLQGFQAQLGRGLRRLEGGTARVANESAPSISSRLDELDRFSKLFSTFVRSYQNVLVDNIETFQNVSRHSRNRLSGSYLGQS